MTDLRTPQADRAAEDHSADRLTLAEGAVIEIAAADRVADHQLKITFSDGAMRHIDFEPFLRRNANPLIRAYLNPANFARFRLEDGDLVWDDCGLCFPVADLYEYRI